MIIAHRFAWTCCLLSLAVAAGGCERSRTAALEPRQIGTVDLSIEFGDAGPGPIRVAIPCSERSTVFSTLQRADRQGDLYFGASGQGERAFVHSINGIANDSSEGRYWVFQVNGTLAERGCGVVEVDPGDVIQWRYGGSPAELRSQ